MESEENRLVGVRRRPRIAMVSSTVFARRSAWPGGPLMPELTPADPSIADLFDADGLGDEGPSEDGSLGMLEEMPLYATIRAFRLCIEVGSRMQVGSWPQ